MKKEQFGLYLILTNPAAGYEACAQAAVSCGIGYLQLRMKNMPVETVFSTAKELRKITSGSSTRFIVNDDLEIAMRSDADGIHLGQSDMPLSESRSVWNTPGKIFGLSTHNMRQAVRALKEHPDYIGIGPVFPTLTKPDAAPSLGMEEAARIAKKIPVTSVAIGGINTRNLPDLLQAGIMNYCVAGAINSCLSNPAEAIRKLQRMENQQAQLKKD